MKIVGAVFFAVFAFMSAAPAAELKCSELIEQINIQNNFILSPARQGVGYFSDRFWIQRKLLNNLAFQLGFDYDPRLKVEEIFQKVDFANVRSQRELENIAAELSLALYGHPHTVDQYFKMSDKERLESSVLRQIRSRLIRDGLIDYWESQQSEPSRWRTFRKNVSKFFGKGVNAVKPVFNFLLTLPFPAIPERQISPALMEDIIWDGFDAHEDKVRNEFKKFDLSHSYNTFRRIIFVSALGTILTVQVAEIVENISRQNELLILNQTQLAQAGSEALASEGNP